MTIIAKFTNANGDGRVYPDECEVRAIGGDLPFQVWDVTGWNGFEKCDDYMVAAFMFESDAMKYAEINYAWWSDPIRVLAAAAGMLDEPKGAFKRLKDAVDWRDRR